MLYHSQETDSDSYLHADGIGGGRSVIGEEGLPELGDS